MQNTLMVFSRGDQDGAVERKAARNYLVIPQNKRVYLILSDGMEQQRVLDLCAEILSSETNNYVVYVFVRRGEALVDRLRESFPCNGPVQPIVVGRKTNLYIHAADVVLTKAGIISASAQAEISNSRRWNVLRSENLRDAIVNAIETVKLGRRHPEGK